MRLVIVRQILAGSLVFAPAAFAQHNTTGSYGNVLHPGVPSPGALRAPAPAAGGSARMGGNGQFSAGRISGGSGSGRTAGGRRSFGGGPVYIPYPVYGGYGTGYGFDGFYASEYPSVHNPAPGTYDPIFGGYNPGPGYAEPFPAESAPAPPTVIINQNFQTDSVHPQLRDYSRVQLPQPGALTAPPAAGPAQAAGTLADDQPTIFLIAMQDHTIRPVIAYWAQGETLHYVSVEGVLDQVSLAQVDRDFSKQLNAERNVPFALPAAR
jgi:hypothetical protein